MCQVLLNLLIHFLNQWLYFNEVKALEKNPNADVWWSGIWDSWLKLNILGTRCTHYSGESIVTALMPAQGRRVEREAFGLPEGSLLLPENPQIGQIIQGLISKNWHVALSKFLRALIRETYIHGQRAKQLHPVMVGGKNPHASQYGPLFKGDSHV